MAREVNTNLFAPTGNDDLKTGKVEALGLGLYTGEKNAIEAIAEQVGVSRNALLHFAVNWFIVQFRAGNIDLTPFTQDPKPAKKKLNLPSE